MEQKDRQFSPDLIVVPVGSTVSFQNRDPIFHNVFSLSKPKNFDLGNYAKDQTRTVTFTKPGVVLVNCHLHTNMAAVIFVTPNQWSARTDDEGHFEMHAVPPGRHTFIAWHKAAGFFRETVDVKEGQTPVVQFIIPLTSTDAPLPTAPISGQ